MDTIAAISSAVGPAARMIVRLSGAQSISIASGLCDQLPQAGEAARAEVSFRDLKFPAWLYLFRSPRSYTGEDLVEFHIPGNTVLANLLLAELLAAGAARLAEPGEFTARAYFNGRLDLTQAEGVAAAISASNQQELSAARRLMAGELARRLAPITDAITQTLALVEVGIDFSDEDVRFLSSDDARWQIDDARKSLDHLLNDSSRFERIAHEPRVVLVGRPNAGKSTLLNRLAGQQRAVVSPVAGTTRDVLSVELPVPRGIVRLMDVAGLEEQPQPTSTQHGDLSEASHIDHLMREHALRTVEEADIVLMVIECVDQRAQLLLSRKPDWIVCTKLDLQTATTEVTARQTFVSAITSAGLDELRNVIDRLAFGESSGGSTLALNVRHVRAIEDAQAALNRAAGQVEAAPELLAMELREALDCLGTIGGRITPDDVLGRVFSAFCIGK